MPLFKMGVAVALRPAASALAEEVTVKPLGRMAKASVEQAVIPAGGQLVELQTICTRTSR
jgi:hypothetical protein